MNQKPLIMSGPNNTEVGSINLSTEIAENLTVHKNVQQDIVVISSDKLKLVLIDSKEAINLQRDWWTPAGVFLAVLIAMLTADFKDTFSIPKETWHTIFIGLAAISLFWFARCIWKLMSNKGSSDLDGIITQIKTNSQSAKKPNE